MAPRTRRGGGQSNNAVIDEVLQQNIDGHGNEEMQQQLNEEPVLEEMEVQGMMT